MDGSKKVDMRIAGVEVDVIVILNLPFQGCGSSMILRVGSLGVQLTETLEGQLGNPNLSGRRVNYFATPESTI